MFISKGISLIFKQLPFSQVGSKDYGLGTWMKVVMNITVYFMSFFLMFTRIRIFQKIQVLTRKEWTFKAFLSLYLKLIAREQEFNSITRLRSTQGVQTLDSEKTLEDLCSFSNFYTMKTFPKTLYCLKEEWMAKTDISEFI